MPPSILPFLYQTRTIQHGLRPATFARAIRLAHSSNKPNYSIPFDWEDDPHHDDFSSKPSSQPSTITPSEAEVFKGIFDEISQGRMPVSKKKKTAFSALKEQTASTSAAVASQSDTKARSIVDQARLTDFRDKFLSRYPSSLRSAAQVALGLFEVPANEDGKSTYMELKEADAANWAERAMYDQLRSEERARVDRLMDSCKTDTELWSLMEREVFSLPERLGIIQDTTETASRKKKKKSTNTKGKAAAAEPAEEPAAAAAAKPDRRMMDVHGRLYPHFIYNGLKLLDTNFKRSSPYVFKILPRVKELGLPSYVLGVSTSFYSRLAFLYWTRFGDSNAALNVLQEMLSSGLYANEESMAVVESIRDHIHGCTWGAQGPFVMAMMESSPYDASLSQRLENMQRYIRTSIAQEKHDGA
ncbi:hypothetical protein PWT90_03581 [Aphanocladium album]|nr:hypothetical protein PWT90_03581 [Aphanocladium album]